MTKPKADLNDLRVQLKRIRGEKIDADDFWDRVQKIVSTLPDSLDKDYWTTADMDVAAIKAKYQKKRWKPKPVELTITCPHCGWIEKVLVRSKEDVGKRGDNWKCPKEGCRFSEAIFPFGKFKGRTVAEVYREQPNYLAWFMEAVEPDSAEVMRIRAEIEKLPGIKKHLEQYHQKQLQAQWTQRSQFSPAAIDDLCDRLFNGE
jgi:uncharacterized protein (DUF3820 family)